MIFFVLFSLTCLFSTTRTKQYPLDEYVQMFYHQQLLAAQHPSNPHARHPNTLYHHQQHQHRTHHPNAAGSYLAAIASSQPSAASAAASFDYKYPATNAVALFKPQALARSHRSTHSSSPSSSAADTEQQLLKLKLEGADTAASSPLAHSHMMRNINQQLLLAENYNNPVGAASAAVGIDDPALIAANLIDSLDVDDHNGHFDYSYLGRDQPQFTAAASAQAINNNSLALFRLLNFIDQSVPPISMPFQTSKTSPPNLLPSRASSSSSSSSAQQNNYNNNNPNHNNFVNSHSITKSNNNRHQSLSRQSSPASNAANANSNANNAAAAAAAAAANYPNSAAGWPTSGSGGGSSNNGNSNQQQQQKERSQQQYWRQQAQLDDNTIQNQQALVDSNSIELQPAAPKMLTKISSSYLNTPPSSPQTPSSSSRRHHHQQQQQQQHGSNGAGAGDGYETGFGSKQHQQQQQSTGGGEKLNGALTSPSLSNSKVPHDADSEMIAANNAPRCDKFTPDICVDDFEYPEQAIIDEIQKKRDVFELMYSEVKDNEPLVDGIPRDVEESYNYDYYYYGKTNLSQAASQLSPQTVTATSVGAGMRLSQQNNQQQQQQQQLQSAAGAAAGLTAHQQQVAGAGNTATAASYRNQRLALASEHDSPASAAAPLLPASVSYRMIGSIRDVISQEGQTGGSGGGGGGGRGDISSSSALPDRLLFGAGNQSMPSGSSPLASSIDGMDALIGAVTSHATSPNPTSQSPPTSGFICPSEVMYGRPKLAKNKKGLWKVIVNAGEFTQTVRLEKCLLPNKRCNYVSAQSYESRCAQVHSHHRLLVFEKGRGFYIDTFRLPTGCNCHVTKKSPAYALSGGGSSSSSSSRNSNNNNQEQLSNGLGNNVGNDGGESGSHNTMLQQQQQVQNQSAASGSSALPGSRLSNPYARSKPSESMLSQVLWSILSGGREAPVGAESAANCVNTC